MTPESAGETVSDVIGVVVTIAVGAAVFAVINVLFRLLMRRSDAIHLRFLRSFLSGLTVVFCAAACMYKFEVTREAGKIILQSSAFIAAALTLVMQKSIGNVISGIVLSSAKPFKVGDKISLLNVSSDPIVTGIVTTMTGRHVVLKTADGKAAVIANGVVDNYIVLNEDTLGDNGRPLSMICSYDSDPTLAMSIMRDTINAHYLTTGAEEASSEVTCASLTPDGFELKAVIFAPSVADSFKACSDLRVGIYKAWKIAGIRVPYDNSAESASTATVLDAVASVLPDTEPVPQVLPKVLTISSD